MLVPKSTQRVSVPVWWALKVFVYLYFGGYLTMMVLGHLGAGLDPSALTDLDLIA